MSIVWPARIAGWALLAAAVIVVAAVAGGRLTGRYELLTVDSGSMQPAFAAGDAVIVVPRATASLRVGEILTYHVPTVGHQVESHRIVWLRHGSDGTLLVRTRGDANRVDDPWTARIATPTSWTVATAIPKAGWLLSKTVIQAIGLVLGLCAIAWLCAVSLRRLWRGSLSVP
jgi:signal peptidase